MENICVTLKFYGKYQQSLISPKLLKGENGFSTLFPLSTILQLYCSHNLNYFLNK